MYQVLRQSLRACDYYLPRSLKLRPVRRSIRLLCATGVASVGVKMQGDTEKLKPPDADTLSHEYLIRNASMLTIDSASALLGQSMVALLQAQLEYLQAVEKLIEFMELNVQVLGNPQYEEAVWQQVLQARSAASNSRKVKEELNMVYHAAEKVIESAAEAAFLSGMEAYSFMASERLHSAQQQLASGQTKVEEIESRLRQIEARVISETSKHEKMKKKKREESISKVDQEPTTLGSGDEDSTDS